MEKKPYLRVISDAMGKRKETIDRFSDDIVGDADLSDPATILRVLQDATTTARAAVIAVHGRVSEEEILDAVIYSFHDEVERLYNAGHLRGYATKLSQAKTKLLPLESAIRKYFKVWHFHVGRARRYAVPVFPMTDLDSQLDVLRVSLKKHASKISDVSGDDESSLQLSEEFIELVDRRAAYRRDATPTRPYALIGVHGGKDTPQYTAKHSVDYFREHHRVGLTLMEAIALFTAHPRFLREQGRVLLLGEVYPAVVEKFAYLESPNGGKHLHVGLVSIEEADKAFQPANPSLNNFHGAPRLPHYGKPYAAVVVKS